MNQKQIVTGLVCVALGFTVGLGGGAVLTRPSRQNYAAQIEKIHAESAQSKDAILAKLHNTQGLAQRLEKEKRQLNNELRNMHTALAETQQNKKTDKAEIVSKPMFGIYLGEKLSDVQKRFEITESPLNKWVVRHTSNDIEDCHINICKDRVYCITVWLKDNTKRKFDFLKQQLKKEYENYQIRGIESSNTKPAANFEFKVTIDDILVPIYLTFIDNFTAYPATSKAENELSIQFIHWPLLQQL